MHQQLAAVADPARWRLLELLAERPRSVGVLAQLAGLRQPQTTKHLQTLERAGLVTSRRHAQRRIYVLEPAAVQELVQALSRLSETADAHRAERDAFDRYFTNVDAEVRAADRPSWADERVFTFRRAVAVSRETLWRHVTDAELQAAWWAPEDLRLTELVFQARPGGRIVQEYADAEDSREVEGAVGRAEGVVDDVRPLERIAFRLSPRLPDGGIAFTGHYEFVLSDAGAGAILDVRLSLMDSAVASAEFVAGIELGWNESLDTLVAILAADPTAKEN